MTKTVVVADADELRQYEPAWRTLAERRSNAFITPDWYFSWLERYAGAAEPAAVVTVGHDGRLRGLVPFVLDKGRRPRSLRFAGGTLADHVHPVCAQEDEDAIAKATATALAGTTTPWSIAILDHVDVDASWWHALGDQKPFVGLATYRSTTLPAIDLASRDWNAYLASRTRNFRDQALRYRRRLERQHHVNFRRTSDASDLARDMETLFALHDARWSARGGSTLESPRARAFHLAFARRALARDWLRLWLLEVDDNPVAAWYGWRVGDRYAYYQAGFDPAWERLSVGFVLMVHTIRSAIEEGASRYDMLLGEERYKRRFANVASPVCTVMLSRSRSGQLLTGAEARAWRATQSLSPRVRARAGALATILPGARRR